VLSRVLERSPYIPVRTSFAQYQEQVPAKQRHDLARRRRRLEEQGEVRLEIRTDVSPEALAEFVRLEESGWKAGDAVAEDTRARRFYTDVAAWAAQRGLLRIAFLRVGEQAIAADLAIETERRHYLLKTGYDPDYRRYGPGKLLRREMVEHAFTAGLDSYEFLGTDEPWKLEWTGHVRDRMAVQAFAPSLTGRFEHAVQAYGRPLAKAVVTASRRRLSVRPPWRGSRRHRRRPDRRSAGSAPSGAPGAPVARPSAGAAGGPPGTCGPAATGGASTRR
jgi:CelD/BcsL family acetyltransferase involved in cellulose biosynthesis